ncbi:hypothetical protein EXIGLDRAFT_845740 [Exidia glandulosa HHB12029]|uniref:Uncharacterized protein n=1 Tax=Exidia glandulosa HHB12029 TaxID=1314781 RepID=A0A165BB16_EXIGL|nr:hypothetical protein EXIGLDRAFT_845740 [Exidia glandulosa HHB12029]
MSEGLYIDIGTLLPRVTVLRLPDQYRYAPLQGSPLGPGNSPEMPRSLGTATASVLLDAREIAQMMQLVRWSAHPAFDLCRALGMNSVKRAMAASVQVLPEPPRQECTFAPGPGAARPAVRDADPVSFAPHVRAQAWEWALGSIQMLVFTTQSFLDVEEGSDSDSDSGASAPATPPSAAPLDLDLKESPTTDMASPEPLREWPQPMSMSSRSADADTSDCQWRAPRSPTQAPSRGRDPWTAFNTSNTESKKMRNQVSKPSRRDRENVPPSTQNLNVRRGSG